MNTVRWLAVTTLFLSAAALVGCSGGEDGQEGPHGNSKSESTPKESKEDAKVKASLAKLSAADRQLAEAQKLCPTTGEPLGEMGVPVKVTIKNQPVFLCCKGCQEEALADADKTLDKVNELKKQNASPR